MKIAIDKIYQSELLANTELHAGGLFFCIIYSNCLSFKNNGEVILTKKVIDPFRPMDSLDIKHLENYKIEGKYYINDRDYLICEFEEIFISLTGMFTVKDPNLIVFNAHDKRHKRNWSELYRLIM